jgi:hypothetical protein
VRPRECVVHPNMHVSLNTPNASRRWRALALAALIVLMLLRVPYAASHMDLARDMFVAWRLLHGEAAPLEGPVLNGMIHLGPVWYYLLALLQLLGRTWYGTIALLGLLASMQIPLAYLLGKELHSRRAGFLWAIGLIVPSWTTYEWMLPLHPILSPLFVLAFLLCCLRYWRGGARRYFYGMALTFTLALHAHPSNIGCAWIGLFVLIRAAHPHVTWRDFALAGLLAIAPLLPFLYADALRGFEDLRKSSAFVANPEATGSAWNLPELLMAITYTGTRYLFDPLTGLSARAAQIATAIIALGGMGGAAGLVVALFNPRSRTLIVVAIGATLAVVLTVAMMRALTPYYMTTSSHVMLAGLVAIGLSCLGESIGARALRTLVAASAVLACVVTTYGNARFEIRGAWPFAWWPMFDVRHAPDEIVPLLLTPAYAMDASGRFLCAQHLPSIHGAYASQLIHNYAMDMRLACGRADVHAGGNESERTHWLGLSRAMFAHSGVRPQQRLGPIGLIPARPVSASPPVLQPDQPRYPAYRPQVKEATPHHLSVPMRAGEHLAISNIGFAFNIDPQVTVQINGKVVEPVARDRVAAVYACAECVSGVTVSAEIDISSGDYTDVDVVLF